MRITRDEIVRAVRTEPLKPMSWYTRKTDGSCTVCAVGGVLRHRVDLKEDYGKRKTGKYLAIHKMVMENSKGQSSSIQPVRAVQAHSYISALSAKFEGLCSRNNIFPFMEHYERKMDVVRKELITWVLQNFPESFEIKLHPDVIEIKNDKDETLSINIKAIVDLITKYAVLEDERV